MDVQTLVLALDKKQLDPATARYCQNDKSHGKLTAHGSGSVLMCGKCNYAEPATIGGN